MEQKIGSVLASTVLEKDYLVSELSIRPRSLNAMYLDPPSMAFPRMMSLQRRKCPQCREQLGGPAELRVLNGVVQALCHGHCGFSVDLFWMPVCSVS